MAQRLALIATVAALVVPAGALAATATVPGTKIPVPASARVNGTTASNTTSTTTSASGAQPGTVAPGSTTPTSSTPTSAIPTTATPSTPAATTPQSATPTGPATAAPATTTPGTPATLGIVKVKPQKSSNRLSGLALILAIVGALLLLAALIWAAARWMGLQPRWTTATMYSLREASYHASATWAEFSDWAKLGR
ncbi:MAG TPA: hypothetical protein VHS55_09860 [Solirubrobacteraceae bacterium]|jgi:hypothetical protein|nr:hypothetical protein [Solirubrobacteraceae bacterium]